MCYNKKQTVPIAIETTVGNVLSGLMGETKYEYLSSDEAKFLYTQNQTIKLAEKMAKVTQTLLPRPIYVDKSTSVMKRMIDRTANMEATLRHNRHYE